MSREARILARASRRQATADEQARQAKDREVLIEAAASVGIAPEHIEAEIDHADRWLRLRQDCADAPFEHLVAAILIIGLICGFAYLVYLMFISS